MITINTQNNSQLEKHWWLPLAVLACAQLSVSADNGAFSIAAANILSTLGGTLADIQLATTVYSLIAGSLMLVSGMLGIAFGWMSVFRMGLILAMAGEFLCAFTPNMTILTWGARGLFGLGASLVIPSVLGMVSVLYEGEQRKKAFGVIAGSAALATILPILLGAAIDMAGFRFTFAGMGIVFGLLLASSSVFHGERKPIDIHSIDIPGSFVASIGLSLLLFGLSRISAWGATVALPTAPFTIGGYSPALPLAFVGLVTLIILLPLEKNREKANYAAILPGSLIGNKTVRAGLVAIGLPFFYMGAQGILATSYYQLALGLSATNTAILGILSGVPMLLGATMIPMKFPKADSRMVIRLGYLFLIAATGFMAIGMRQDYVSWYMLVATLLGGIGVGLVNSQANNVVASAVSAQDSQKSGGIQGAARNLGLALGTAIAGSLLIISMNNGVHEVVTSLDANLLAQSQRETLEQNVFTFEPTVVFEGRLDSVGDLNDEVRAELTHSFEQVRYNAASKAMLFISGVCAVALLTTGPLRIKTAPTSTPEADVAQSKQGDEQ